MGADIKRKQKRSIGGRLLFVDFIRNAVRGVASMFERKTLGLSLVWATLIGALLMLPGPLAAQENANLYVVSGVKVDARDADAAKAKLKAITEAQVKAFTTLLERIGGAAEATKAKNFTPSQIGRMMASLSVEEERTGPGRYIGKLTIKFLPNRVRNALSEMGVTYVEEQSPAIVVIPLWRQADGTLVLWQDNPWRTAWQNLKAENALVPVIVPLGDVTDVQTLTIEEVVQQSENKFEAIRLRYSAEAVLIALAEPASDNSVHAVMNGESPVGKIGFDKTYVATQGGIEAAAIEAAARFHTVMVFKWKKSRTTPAQTDANLQAVNIAVPFNTLREWNALRSQLTITPGVVNVDVSSLASNGAVVRLTYAQGFENLRAALGQYRLDLILIGGTWVLQPY